MRLRKFQVRAFRCIHDSGEVPVGDLAALIGKNENGKTALLQALMHLSKELPIKELDRCDEMWDTLQANPQLRIVEGTFELTSDESKVITEQIAGAPPVKTLRAFRCAEGPIQYEFPGIEFGSRTELDPSASSAFQKYLQDFRATLEPFRKGAESAPGPLEPYAEELDSICSALTSLQSTDKEQTATAIARLKAIAGNQTQLAPSLKSLETAARKAFKEVPIRPEVEKLIREKFHPRFVYFSAYKQIQGAVRISQYLAGAGTPQDERLDTGEPLDKRETIDNLFYLAGLDPKRLEAIKNSPALKNKYLGECSARLTLALRPTWVTQPIDVELVYDTGDVLWVKITDVHDDGRRTNKGPLSRRAAGFIWHFSFFVNFTAETRKAELRDAILLLDEPGLHLHPAQQAGTLDVLRQLAESNQIIYTTHSPFMIFDYTVGHLLTVELDRDTHLSTIRPAYWDSEPETLIPILHALGTPEAFAGATREMSRRPVAVIEGITDYQYLISTQDYSASRRPQASQVLANVNLVPASSSSAIGPLAMYHRRRKKEVVAVYDNEPRARKLAEVLVKLGFPEGKIKFCRVEDKLESDIEDLFTESEYLCAVNAFYSEALKDARFIPITSADIRAKRESNPSLTRIVPLLEAIWDDHKPQKWGSFSKKGVCDKLCELMYEDSKLIGERTLERFEALFKEIATALKPSAAAAEAAAGDKSAAAGALKA